MRSACRELRAAGKRLGFVPTMARCMRACLVSACCEARMQRCRRFYFRESHAVWTQGRPGQISRPLKTTVLRSKRGSGFDLRSPGRGNVWRRGDDVGHRRRSKRKAGRAIAAGPLSRRGPRWCQNCFISWNRTLHSSAERCRAVAIIRRMVRDLNIPAEIVSCPMCASQTA